MKGTTRLCSGLKANKNALVLRFPKGVRNWTHTFYYNYKLAVYLKDKFKQNTHFCGKIHYFTVKNHWFDFTVIFYRFLLSFPLAE